MLYDQLFYSRNSPLKYKYCYMLARFSGKVIVLGKTLIGATSELAPMVSYQIGDFLNPSGTTMDGVSLAFNPSATVQIDWGDGSIEPIISNTNYSHTFN